MYTLIVKEIGVYMKYVIRLLLIFFCFFQEKAFSIVDFDNILPLVNVPPYLQPKIHIQQPILYMDLQVLDAYISV